MYTPSLLIRVIFSCANKAWFSYVIIFIRSGWHQNRLKTSRYSKTTHLKATSCVISTATFRCSTLRPFFYIKIPLNPTISLMPPIWWLFFIDLPRWHDYSKSRVLIAISQKLTQNNNFFVLHISGNPQNRL